MYQDYFSDDEIDAALIDLAIQRYKMITNAKYGWSEGGWTTVLKRRTGEKVHLEELGIGATILKNTYQYDGYDESPQGGAEFQVVLKLDGDERFWSRIGNVDSYGAIAWDNGLESIQGQTKTITVFE